MRTRRNIVRLRREVGDAVFVVCEVVRVTRPRVWSGCGRIPIVQLVVVFGANRNYGAERIVKRQRRRAGDGSCYRLLRASRQADSVATGKGSSALEEQTTIHNASPDGVICGIARRLHAPSSPRSFRRAFPEWRCASWLWLGKPRANASHWARTTLRLRAESLR